VARLRTGGNRHYTLFMGSDRSGPVNHAGEHPWAVAPSVYFEGVAASPSDLLQVAGEFSAGHPLWNRLYLAAADMYRQRGELDEAGTNLRALIEYSKDDWYRAKARERLVSMGDQ